MKKYSVTKVPSVEEIDFKKSVNGQIYYIGDNPVSYNVRVSKGRKLLDCSYVTHTTPNCKFRVHGYMYERDRHDLLVTLVFDYGKTIITTARSGIAGNRSYDMPGKITSNVWDLYNYYFLSHIKHSGT